MVLVIWDSLDRILKWKVPYLQARSTPPPSNITHLPVNQNRLLLGMCGRQHMNSYSSSHHIKEATQLLTYNPTYVCMHLLFHVLNNAYHFAYPVGACS